MPRDRYRQRRSREAKWRTDPSLLVTADSKQFALHSTEEANVGFVEDQ